jgi:hypothetical protein
MLKVQFPKDYRGTALVQMRNTEQVDLCIRYLDGELIFTDAIVVTRSTLSEVNGDDRALRSYDSCTYWNFERCSHFQFIRSNASKNLVVAPCEVMIVN